MLLGHLLQLLMSLEADAWAGTRGSNWNRLIDERRCVWVDKCPNAYVEVVFIRVVRPRRCRRHGSCFGGGVAQHRAIPLAT